MLLLAACAAPTPPAPREIPAYNRSDWPHWVDADRDCQKSRDEVLIAESEIPVSFRDRDDGKACKVTQGQWTGPYGGETFADPTDLDIDHLVPLKNAHLSGAWAWTRKRRREYANDLEHDEHLVAVKARLNRQKGSKGRRRGDRRWSRAGAGKRARGGR